MRVVRFFEECVGWSIQKNILQVGHVKFISSISIFSAWEKGKPVVHI